MKEGDMTTGSFTIQAQMPMGKSITVSGYIYAHNTREDISAQVDILHDVVDRQRLRAEIPELEAKLEQRINALASMKDVMASLNMKKEAGLKLTSSEKKQIDDMSISIRRVNEDLEKGRIAIEEAKEKCHSHQPK
jgi:chromosome segregation ATPase